VGGSLGRCLGWKTVLLVESVVADGVARVVYAFGDNPWVGIRRGWSCHEATVSGGRLTISEAGFSAAYDLNDQGRLDAMVPSGDPNDPAFARRWRLRHDQ
jgi:hypothetical protein